MFKELIERLRDQSDKETNKQLLFQEYKKYTAPQLTPLRDEFVKELIHQFEEYIEKAHFLYLNHYNDTE